MPTDMTQWLLFDLENQSRRSLMALPVENILGVADDVMLSKVPLTPAWFKGLMNYHGKVINVVDPAPLLDLPTQVHMVNTVVVMAPSSSNPQRLGLCVAGVREVVEEESFENADLPASSGVNKVVKHGEELLSLISAEALGHAISKTADVIKQQFHGGLSK